MQGISAVAQRRSSRQQTARGRRARGASRIPYSTAISTQTPLFSYNLHTIHLPNLYILHRISPYPFRFPPQDRFLLTMLIHHLFLIEASTDFPNFPAHTYIPQMRKVIPCQFPPDAFFVLVVSHVNQAFGPLCILVEL